MDQNESCSAGEDDYNSETEEQGAGFDDHWSMDNYPGHAGGYGRARRAAWTSDEERRLAQLAARYSNAGQRMCWRIIAQELNTGRTSKQCREHYLNSLRPNMKKGGWTQREEYIISREHSRIGSHWCIIAKKLPGRTDNSIKNFFNATVRSKAVNKTESILWLYVDRLRSGRQPKDAFVEACEVWSAYMPQAVVQEVMHGKSGKPGSQGSGQSSGHHVSTNSGMMPRSGSFTDTPRGSRSPCIGGLQPGMMMQGMGGGGGGYEVAADDGAEALMLLAGKCVPAADGADDAQDGNHVNTRTSRTSSGTDYNKVDNPVAAKVEPGVNQEEEQEAEQGEGGPQAKRLKVTDSLATLWPLLSPNAPSMMQMVQPGAGLAGLGTLPLNLGSGLTSALLRGSGAGLTVDTLQQLQLEQLLMGMGVGSGAAVGGVPNGGNLPLQSLLQQLGAQQLLQQQLQQQLSSALGGASTGLLPAEQLLAAQSVGLQQQLLHNASLLQALDATKQGAATVSVPPSVLPQIVAANAGLQQQLANPAATLQQQLSSLQAGGGVGGQQQYIIISVPANTGAASLPAAAGGLPSTNAVTAALPSPLALNATAPAPASLGDIGLSAVSNLAAAIPPLPIPDGVAASV